MLNSCLKFIVTPHSTSFSHFMLFPFKLNVIFCLCVLLPIAIAWKFSGFSCILLDENDDIGDFVIVAKEVSDFEGVLSSA